MITIISPTTTMSFDKKMNIKDFSIPIFSQEAGYLMASLKSLSVDDVSNLMKLSNELSSLNFERYKNFGSINNPRSQSLLAFDGEVFNSMDVSKFNDDDIYFANEHLRILSGLYGVLKPLDIIEPYRLEMKSKLANNAGKDLYKFWKDKVTNYIISELDKDSKNTLVNLASSEYLKCIDLKLLRQKHKFIDIIFKEYNPTKDTYTVKGLYSKKARGYMVSYIIKNKINKVENLKNFNIEGYAYNPDLSSDDSYVFTR